jgi:hypothetical protein
MTAMTVLTIVVAVVTLACAVLLADYAANQEGDRRFPDIP